MNRKPHHRKLPDHRKVPDHWTLVAGKSPPDDFGFKSDRLQIIYNNTSESWHDESSHAHADSDEVYIVLEGVMSIEVGEKVIDVRAGEVLCVPAGVFHRLVVVATPVKSLVIRSPSVNDKVFQSENDA
jgi:mannose-6-phosphate isomerase-like protein (cupin superfamily)